ncbi:FMN-dependent dehydrogenase-domain-containing protein [Massariosphaeria phaeospora]|uniref:L-lactate dehydrogenase (cytochrome) n=1 Tax=Massariosphaeria phaeospora TaxID=100035 RepID=A0A7C8MHD2_9PLEO|nr:FMN-dependent dehydrogenase-domain-containing protein [Massariosphaeria phaeospora]
MTDASVPVEDIKKHSSKEDCWIVVDDVVWDITDFVPSHPGGHDIIYRHAGYDASAAYNAIHSPSLISKTLGPTKCRGKVDSTTSSALLKPPPTEAAQPKLVLGAKPPLSSLINSYDFEAVAEKALTKKAWAFYSSAATNLVTRDANRNMFDRIWFRPRLLRNVRDVNTKTKILGADVNLPFFVSPAALARLAHPDGELALARGSEKFGIAQCISTNASYTMAEITSSVHSDAVPFFFQLYVNKDRIASEVLLKDAEKNGIKAIWVTIDGPVQGKREADERVKVDSAVVASTAMSGETATNDTKGGGIGRTTGGYIDPTFSWDDLAWLRRHTKLPIVVKGVQTAEDAVLALNHGLDGIVISNHGGRNLDTSPPSLLTLMEIRRHNPEVFQYLEVYLDCGVRRGTDIVKALCLGAKAVGMGRPFLYSLTYGQEGVEHFIEIMKDELETSMRLLGITDLSQAHPRFLNTCEVEHLIPKTLESPFPEVSQSIPRARL